MRTFFGCLILILIFCGCSSSAQFLFQKKGAAGASCTLPWGGSIESGSSVTAYQNSVGLLCDGGNPSQTRTCSNGTLSGSYTYQNANNRNCNCYQGYAPAAGWYAHGTAVYANSGDTFFGACPYPNSDAVCSNGQWTWNGLNITSAAANGAWPQGQCKLWNGSPNASGK